MDADEHRFFVFFFFICDNQRNLRPYLLLDMKCVSLNYIGPIRRGPRSIASIEAS